MSLLHKSSSVEGRHVYMEDKGQHGTSSRTDEDMVSESFSVDRRFAHRNEEVIPAQVLGPTLSHTSIDNQKAAILVGDYIPDISIASVAVIPHLVPRSATLQTLRSWTTF